MAAKKKSTAKDKGRLPTTAEKRKVMNALKRLAKGHKELQQHVELAQKQLQDLDFIDI